jgi:peptide chain release factor 1
MEQILEKVKEEIKTTNGNIETMERELLFAVLPKDFADEANAILEIRAGTGGDDAGLLVAES